MEVIIHLPRSKEGQEELAKRVATVHAQLIYNYISRLECSTEQKVALLARCKILCKRFSTKSRMALESRADSGLNPLITESHGGQSGMRAGTA